MQLYVFSDTYMGLDELIDIDFTVKPAADLPAYEPHPEDLELENEPTLFEQVMAANQDEADSSDDEDGEIPSWAAKKDGSSGKGSANDAGKGHDSKGNTTTSSADDDSDEDSEED